MSDTPLVRLEIESLEIVGQWEYKDCEMCDLCKKNLMEIPPTKTTTNNIANIEKFPSVSIGKCQHAFHTNCIDSSVNSGNLSCPTCKTPWDTEKTTNKNDSKTQTVNYKVINAEKNNVNISQPKLMFKPEKAIKSYPPPQQPQQLQPVMTSGMSLMQKFYDGKGKY